MRIARARIVNFKCFADSGSFSLSPSFNVLVGQNDSGKSALLDALVQQQPNASHRSLRTVPYPGAIPQASSRVEIDYSIAGTELLSWVRSRSSFSVPVIDGGANRTVERVNELLRLDGQLACQYETGTFPRGQHNQLGQAIEPGLYCNVVNRAHPTNAELKATGEVRGNVQDYGTQLADLTQRSMYVFKAERLYIGQCAIQGESVLTPNAANLPDVLNQLATRNLPQYTRLLDHVRTIFPHITHVSAPLIQNSGNQVQILVWHTDPALERSDLTVPLAESGTGISQVLAMLYVAVTSRESRVIAIDEPQSFLHPGAVRKLFEILRAYKQHQYIVTTHAPLAMDIRDGDAMLLVRRTEEGSTVSRLDDAKQQDLRVFLGEVGARLSDVFGADSILWVEGATEESCFPVILRELCGMPLKGVQILGVLSTDELSGRHATRVLDVYQRLSRGPTVMPPALAFVFDREGRSDTQRADVERASRGLVRWLPRRMFENYLLNPAALAAILSERRDGEQVTREQVERWLTTNSSRYVESTESARYPEARWFEVAHGAKLLGDLFSEMTRDSGPTEYLKVAHGQALTHWLVLRRDPALIALAEYLKRLVHPVV